MSQEEQAEKEPEKKTDPRKRKRRIALASLAAIFVLGAFRIRPSVNSKE